LYVYISFSAKPKKASASSETRASFVPNDADDDYIQGFRIYKFHPAAASTYEYVAECSNRGICDSSSGVCTCFPGYGNDNCDEQNALAV
jgi:hypothetical protein